MPRVEKYCALENKTRKWLEKYLISYSGMSPTSELPQTYLRVSNSEDSVFKELP